MPYNLLWMRTGLSLADVYADYLLFFAHLHRVFCKTFFCLFGISRRGKEVGMSWLATLQGAYSA
jgi:hypothetical protein